MRQIVRSGDVWSDTRNFGRLKIGRRSAVRAQGRAPEGWLTPRLGSPGPRIAGLIGQASPKIAKSGFGVDDQRLWRGRDRPRQGRPTAAPLRRPVQSLATSCTLARAARPVQVR